MRTCLVVAAAVTSMLVGSSSLAAPRVVAQGGEARPWLHVGPVGVSAPLEAKLRARAFLERLAPEASRLSLTTTTVESFGDGDKIVRFEQTHLGLPIVGAEAAVRIDARGEHVLTSAALEKDLPPDATPSIAPLEAAQTAQRFTAVGVIASDAHLVWLPTRVGVKLAYAVVPLVPFGLPTAPRIMVDAHTGRVLEARDMVRFVDKARVYETNPTKSPTLTSKQLPIATVGGKLANDFIVSNNCVDQKSVKSVSFQGFPLTVHVCDMATRVQANGTGDYEFDPDDDPNDVEARRDMFSEVSMYYHASRAYQFFRGLQGDDNAQVVVDKPFRTISNLQIAHGLFQGDLASAAKGDLPLDPFQNAFFSPAGGGLGQVFEQLYGFNAGAMWFGQGPRRDYSYDGDVIYHEFTHAVVDKTLKLGAWHADQYGLVDAPGAMNEGLADYFSSALAGDPDVGEYASQDIAPGMKVIRSLANQDKCPSAIAGEVHFDSTLFSGGLWEARSTLSDADKTKFDASLYKAMRSHAGRGDLGYDDLTKLFLESLRVDLPAGATALETAMTGRGVLPECARTLEFTGAPIKAPGPMGGFAAPGVQNLATADLAPGIVQVFTKLPERSTKVTVTFSARVQQQQAPGGLGGGGTPFTPVLLAKFGEAVKWTTKGALSPEVDAKVDPTSDGGKTIAKFTADIDVPEGATSVYVQIANKGDSDGTYDGVALAIAQSDAPPAGEDPGNGGAKSGAGAPTSSSSGCGCSVPATHASYGGLFAGALGLAGLVARRRRR